jgi:hypothetical protein
MALDKNPINVLLEEGARSYLAAVTAISAFEHEVQKKCRERFSKRLDEYSAALQIQPRLTSTEIQSVIWPSSREEFDGSWRSVGVAIQGKKIPPSYRWWGMYCSLDWEAEGNYFGVGISEGIAPAATAGQVFKRFQALNAEVVAIDSKEFGMWQTMNVEDVGRFEEILDSLMETWIELWRKVGGMKSVLK